MFLCERGMWLVARGFGTKISQKTVYVCSFHSADKKPTELYPDLELYLGYNRPPPKK